MTLRLLLEFALLVLLVADKVFGQMRHCNYQERPPRQRYHRYGSVNGSEQHCHFTNCCMGVYAISDEGELEVDTLACYLRTCSDFSCVQYKNLLRCLCNADLCNNTTFWIPEEEKPGPVWSLNDGILVAGLVVGLMALLVLCVATLRIIYKKTKSPSSPLDPLCAAKPLDTADLELLQVLCRGTFACIWAGRHQGEMVVVKAFPKANKHVFTAERAVHKLPFMEHPNIVQLLGSGSVGACEVLVLQYATHGSLHSYLTAHSSSWTSALALCHSLSLGLSYIHEKGENKLAVAHGDLSSSNVLVKADGTCALCDFGCSTVLDQRPGHFVGTQAEGGRGTLRYMSPEILEGYVILGTDWCLHADVYSLGLVLWEVWMRCSDLFKGEAVPLHLLPYEQELGPSVSVESLLQHVLYSGQRPRVPELWQQHPQGAALAELLDCCWDSDADARVSAAYVVDKLASFESPPSDASGALDQ